MRKIESLYFSAYAFISYIVVYIIFGDFEAAAKATKASPINVSDAVLLYLTLILHRLLNLYLRIMIPKHTNVLLSWHYFLPIVTKQGK